MATTTTKATAEDLARLPDDGWRYELIDGELQRMPPAGGKHGEVGTEFVRHLGNWVVPADLGKVYTPDTGFYIYHEPLTIVAPGASFVRKDRLPPADEREGYLDVIPDLVVEVVSPSESALDVEHKVSRYRAVGVPLVWVAYPRRRAVLAHRLGQDAIAYGEEDILDGADILPGFTVPVADLFR